MSKFKEEYHRKETEKTIEKAIEDLKRAKKQGIKKNNVNVAMFNIGHAVMKMNSHINYMKKKYPEEYN